MPEACRWSDAEKMAAWLTMHRTEDEVLHLIARLPFLPETTLASLLGLPGHSHLYRCLDRLGASRLVAAIRPALRPGPRMRLYYPTDLGLAVLALGQGAEPAELAARLGLRQRELLGRVPQLPALLACYDLLNCLAAKWPTPPTLRGWEAPWRRRVQRATAKAPVTVTLPAAVTFSVADTMVELLLLPDLGGCPARAYRETVSNLLALRARQLAPFPTLVVATPDHARTEAWQELLEDVRRAHREAPLPAHTGAWSEFQAGTAANRPRREPAVLLADDAAASDAGATGPSPRHPIPRLIGELGTALRSSDRSRAGLGRLALMLGPADRALLDFVARHPFRSTGELALALDRDVLRVHERRERLVALGLLDVLGPDAPRQDAPAELVECSRAGLALLAAHHGLSLANAVRWQGWAGGGVEHPIGNRPKLVQDLAHTRGVDAIFLGLLRTARTRAARGHDDALIEWRSAAASSRGHVRPDGYGLYRHAGQLYGFFVEYDRGTTSLRSCARKLAAYDEYWASGRFARDYVGFPTILVVTTSYAAERRFAAATRLAALGRGRELPLLLTTEERLHGKSNPQGLLGPIWRTPRTPTDDRRGWLLERARGHVASVDSVSRRSGFPSQCARRRCG